MTSREQTITVLNRLTSSSGTTAINVIIDFLNTHGYNDVADAMITCFNTTSIKATSALDATLVSQARNRNFSAKTHHDPV